MSKLIESELLRQNLWNKYILNFVIDQQLESNSKKLTKKEIISILTRFIFNKITYRSSNDDPVFIISESNESLEQIILDFEYFKITNTTYLNFYNQLLSRFKICFNEFQNTSIENDEKIEVKNNELIYKNIVYKDVSNLGKISDKHAFALNLRYDYLNLKTHGLANNYFKMGFRKNEKVIEAFASSFNKYFDNSDFNIS
jgi:hypothetical protein